MSIIRAVSFFQIAPFPFQFEGQWFSIAVILDRGELTNTNMHQIHLKARENDSFSIMVQMPEEDCKRLYFDLCMSGKPGRFRRISGKQDNPVTVIETDYASFAIIGVQTGSIRALHLYSRTSEASDAVKEKYLFVAKCINFPVNKLIYLTVQTDMCEPPSAFPDFGDTCKAEESE
uniref:Neutrophil gelatinase-associated lipocalin-like n=1 Tax=Pogona vitticeps TaxID=103695 RepID=A0ABM5F6U9_9SAUR